MNGKRQEIGTPQEGGRSEKKSTRNCYKESYKREFEFVLWHFQMDKFEGYTQSFMYIVVKMNIF